MRTTPTSVQDVKLPWITKICFGISGVGRMLNSVLAITYLFYFYTEILMLNPAVATTLTTVGRIWSWFVDPTMGAIIDRSSGKKEGKTRHILKVWTFPAALSMFLAFAVPDMVTPLQALWVFVTYIAQQTLDSLLKVALNTMMGRLTSDKVQRTNLNQVMTIASTVTSLFFTSEVLNIINILGGEDMRRGFMLTAAIFAVATAVIYFITYFGTAGYEPVEPVSPDAVRQKGPGIITTLSAMSKNKVWMIAILIYVFYCIGGIIQSQTMVIYFTHNLGDPQSYLRIYSATSMVVMMVGYVTLGFFTKRLGNAGTALLGCILGVVGNLIRFVLQDATLAAFAAGMGIGAFGSGLLGGTIILCIMDSQVYGEWKTGMRNDALVMSGFGLSSKIGFAVGGALAGYLQAILGYDAALGAPSEAVQTLFFYENTLFMAISFALSAVCAFYVWRYEKRIPQMRAEIQARKAQAS